jgi:hypothetical protein
MGQYGKAALLATQHFAQDKAVYSLAGLVDEWPSC